MFYGYAVCNIRDAQGVILNSREIGLYIMIGVLPRAYWWNSINRGVEVRGRQGKCEEALWPVRAPRLVLSDPDVPFSGEY